MGQYWHLFQSIIKMILRRPVAGTSIVPVLPDGQIVLVRRRDNGRWALPGGMVDWGEDIASAIQRELLEETGLNLVKIRRLVGVYSSPNRDPRMHSICVVVEAEVSGTFHIQDTLEISEAQAFSPDRLPDELLSHDHTQQLQDYLSGQTILA
jgi:ADP-ribose pyrophosphatase YjhB (NUDIX family)